MQYELFRVNVNHCDSATVLIASHRKAGRDWKKESRFVTKFVINNNERVISKLCRVTLKHSKNEWGMSW